MLDNQSDAVVDITKNAESGTDLTISDLTESNQNTFDYLEKVSDQDRKTIIKQTPELLEKFSQDRNALLNYGVDAVSGVNNVVNMILSEMRNQKIPEIDNMLRGVNRDLDGFSAKYKGKTNADLEKKSSKILRFFKSGKRLVQDFYFDSQQIENKMDIIGKKLVNHENELERNIVSSDLLEKENAKSVQKLIYVIAQITQVHSDSIEKTKSLQAQIEKIDVNSVSYQEKQNEIAKYTDMITALEIQRSDYISRLFVALATVAQIRNNVKISSDLKQRITLLRNNVLPTMKLTMTQIIALQKTVMAGKAISTMIDANNSSLQMLADTSKAAIPELAKLSGTSVISVETIVKMTESIIAQNTGLIDAVEKSRGARRATEQAIAANAALIADSAKLRDEEIVKVVMKTTSNDSAALPE